MNYWSVQSLQNISINKKLPWFSEIIKKLEVVYIPDVDTLPPDAEEEKAYFKKRGIRSLFIVPMVIKGELFGFLGFDSISELIDWSLNDRALTRLCSEIFVYALNRKEVEKQRIRELDCLYGISHMVENEELTLEDILQGIVNIIEESWVFGLIIEIVQGIFGTSQKPEKFRPGLLKL